MKYFKVIFLLLLTLFLDTRISTGQGAIQKVVFNVKNEFGQIQKMGEMMKDVLKEDDSSGVSDSFNIMFAKFLEKKIDKESTFPNEIIIEAQEDNWIRKRYYNDSYSHFLKIRANSDSIQVLSNSDSTAIVTYKMDRECSNFNIRKDTSMRKLIGGYNCYYVKVVEYTIDEDLSDKIGGQVYEMWVTDDIDIPVYTVLKNDCRFDGFFPLETKAYNAELPKNITHYTLKSIE